jgi:hypothetical protein
MSRFLAYFLVAATLPAADLTVTTGAQFTPNKTADAGLYQQQSRPGPSAGVGLAHWFGAHQGIAFEVDYANTNTRLADFSQNTWTMNRLSFDGVYEYRWNFRRISPFAKGGIGSMLTLSGEAPAKVPVGMDGRLEEVAGVGVSYRLRHGFSAIAEYDCRFFRNPDFTDHTWKPQRNEVSEPKVGLTYSFGRAE